MQRVGVGLRIDRDRAHAEALRGARDAAGDLAAIGDQDGSEHEGPDLNAAPICHLSALHILGDFPAFARQLIARLWTAWRFHRVKRRAAWARACCGARRRRLCPASVPPLGHAGLSGHDADRRDRGRGRKLDIDRRRCRRHRRRLVGGRARRRGRLRRAELAPRRRPGQERAATAMFRIAADMTSKCGRSCWRRCDACRATARMHRRHPVCSHRRSPAPARRTRSGRPRWRGAARRSPSRKPRSRRVRNRALGAATRAAPRSRRPAAATVSGLANTARSQASSTASAMSASRHAIADARRHRAASLRRGAPVERAALLGDFVAG